MVENVTAMLGRSSSALRSICGIPDVFPGESEYAEGCLLPDLLLSLASLNVCSANNHLS